MTVMMMGLALEMNADPDQQVSAHKNGNAGDFDPQNHTIAPPATRKLYWGRNSPSLELIFSSVSRRDSGKGSKTPVTEKFR